MTVQQAIDELQKLPKDGILMVASLGHGGSVPLQAFEHADDSGWFVDGKIIKPQQPLWVNVIYCEDSEREDYGLEVLMTDEHKEMVRKINDDN